MNDKTSGEIIAALEVENDKLKADYNNLKIKTTPMIISLTQISTYRDNYGTPSKESAIARAALQKFKEQ